MLDAPGQNSGPTPGDDNAALAALQTAMAAFVWDAQATPQADLPAVLADEVQGLGLTPAARLSIHRNNTRITLIEALGENFPAVRRLVGEEFFSACAGLYLKAAPPPSPMLFELGAEFADFLDQFPPAASLPYLGDVARLEQARRIAWHAADADPLTVEDLAALPPESYGALRFVCHPSVHLLRSAYPLSAIYAANRSDEATDDAPVIDLEAGGEAVLVLRPGDDLMEEPIGPPLADLLDALAAGQSLMEAAAPLMALDPGFPLGPSLARLFELGVFVHASADDPV
ncbi:MAG: putative DNA-binding domain-containing protein [Rhodospirillaceae bacterium]